MRRRGFGRQLYDFMLERVKAAGRTKIMGNSVWSLPGIEAHDGGAGPAFAKAMGLELRQPARGDAPARSVQTRQ